MILLVIDTQDMIMTENLYAYDRLVQNISELISTARQRNTEVLYVRHDDGFELTKGKVGFDIVSQFAPNDKEKIFDKNFNSAFRNTGLVDYLTEKQQTHIMVVGLQTDYCIDATIKCGFEHGFRMVVPAFCNTTIDNEFMTGEQSYRYYNEKIWNKRYADCVSFEDALKML